VAGNRYTDLVRYTDEIRMPDTLARSDREGVARAE
jgi:hypothetical protein